MKRAVAFLAMTAGVAAAGAAQAQVTDDKRGWYAGLGYGVSRAPDACNRERPLGQRQTCDGNDKAVNLLLGNQFSRNWAVEGSYIRAGKVLFSGGELQTVIWDLVGVGLLPTTNTFAFMAKVGFFRSETNMLSGLFGNSDHLETGPTVGVGAQWDLTRNLALRADWQMWASASGSTASDSSDIHRLGLNLLWRFR